MFTAGILFFPTFRLRLLTQHNVIKVDPALERTVLVSTKLDTKLPQFSDPGVRNDTCTHTTMYIHLFWKGMSVM